MSTEKKLTAVEWLVEHFKEYGFRVFEHEIEIQQAKEKEKQQIIDAFEEGALDIMHSQQYYEETYKKD